MAQTKVRFDRAVEGATNIVDSGTEGTKVASGTTAQRGSTTGQWRYNSTTGFFEGRNTDGTFSTLQPDPVVSSVDDGEVVEFTDSIIEERQCKIADEAGFEIIDHSLTLYFRRKKS